MATVLQSTQLATTFVLDYLSTSIAFVMYLDIVYTLKYIAKEMYLEKPKRLTIWN